MSLIKNKYYTHLSRPFRPLARKHPTQHKNIFNDILFSIFYVFYISRSHFAKIKSNSHTLQIKTLNNLVIESDLKKLWDFMIDKNEANGKCLNLLIKYKINYVFI